jgi:mutator protein MutT
MTTVVAAIIVRNSRLLICQRRGDKTFPLKWEFPGGKVEVGESLTEALRREILEELGVAIEIGREVYRTEYSYAELSAPIELVFYFARIAGEKNSREFSDEEISAELESFNASGEFEKVVWVTPTALPQCEFLAANSELIDKIADGSLSLE